MTIAQRTPLQDMLGLAGFVALCLLVSVLGGAVTATSVDAWYQTIEKPPFNPPDWLFAPVWISLFIMMAIAGWRIWKRAGFGAEKLAFTLFATQLVLNLAWSVLFFGLQQIGLALVEICLLLITIVATAIVFWRVDRVAGMLFVPYVLWVGFATLLNASLFLLN
jgi:tryptophan-rich sensory protein